jgi:prepilin-type N-terminal cleavage/methylation domain-containing protein
MMHNNLQQGFSLVEVLVSITILLLVIVGPLQIIARSINSTNFATEQVNAWFLAQEGIELVQKGRDDAVLADFEDKLGGGGGTNPMTVFLAQFDDCMEVSHPDGCGVTIGDTSAATVSVIPCNVIDCRLQLTPASASDRARYVHAVNGANAVTPYTRSIKMERFPAAGRVREIKVTSTVTWRTGSLISSQRVEAVSYLFNVYDTN